ncbi:MAG: hypothetical protein P8X74_15535 [Reinekea sp.]
MNSLQAKVLSFLLITAGLGLAGYGGYGLYQAWDHNQQVGNTDQALGGLITTVSNTFGADVMMSYDQPAIFAGIGLVVLLLGWVTLGRVK